MPDQSDRQKLDLALAVSDQTQVEQALGALSEMAEPDRRRVLRPHWEDPEGITDQRDIAIRRGFDLALNQLAALEFSISTGFLPLEMAVSKIDPRLLELLKSRAVARFIDDYDYFQIRFLANRIGLREFKLPRIAQLPALDAAEELDKTAAAFLQETIAFQSDAEVQQLYAFLDDYTVAGMEKGCQQDRFRLWLADGEAERDPQILKYFEILKRMIAKWVVARCRTYDNQPEPVQARFAVFDIYWLLKLFNAEISTSGDVAYCGSSWLTLVAESPHFGDNQDEPDFIAEIVMMGAKVTRADVLGAKRTLRRALGLACDWIRGEAVEREPQGAAVAAGAAEPTQGPVSWIDAFKAELQEILEHRKERHLIGAPGVDSRAREPFIVRHGLIGLAFSGGGIRSATFNLGVLEALKENDFLRFADYLSTVSGGGYIGAWLVGNAKRRGYWIRREADWRESVKHLRDYSDYLSPHLGFMSADTWTMWTTFLRNTILVQLQVFLAIAACLLVPYLLRTPFLSLLGVAGDASIPFFQHPVRMAAVLLALCTALVCGSMVYRRKPLYRGSETPPKAQQRTIGLAVLLLIPASLCVTAALWRFAAFLLNRGADSYGRILSQTLGAAYAPLVLEALYIALAALALISVQANWKGILTAVLAPLGALAALVLEACALTLVLQGWLSYAPMDLAGREAAFVFGPALVIAALSLTVYALIGLLGRGSDAQRREWWSRYGALLSMAGAGWLLLTVAAVYGPFWIVKLESVKWVPILGWVATSLGSVWAGKSGSTSGDGKSKASQVPIEVLAVAGPFVAIAGLILVLSNILHSVLLALSPNSAGGYWAGLGGIGPGIAWAAFGIVMAVGLLLTWRVDINIFGLSEFYRSRLVRCYLGATRNRRNPHPFTGFDEEDDLALASLRTRPPAALVKAGQDPAERAPFAGPFPIVNCTLNLGGSSDLAVKTRRSDCFTMTPLHCGFNHKDPRGRRFAAAGGYCATENYFGSEGSPRLGMAVAVSGAAANPNMGYHTSPLTAFLMTVFNARLGCWFANPSLKTPISRIAPHFALPSLLKELFGTADDESRFVDISDGGHFENLGIYELVRRHCRLIIASDAECDPDMTFGSLGNVIRLCEVDFGAKIKIDVSSIRKAERTGRSTSHCAVGKIEYGNGGLGTLIYIKSSLVEGENTAVLEYLSEHPEFPHESTADQFFTEDQFESYRKLGYDCTKRTFRDTALKNVRDEDLESFAQELTDTWTPVKNAPASFISSANSLSLLWDALGKDPDLRNLSNEIINHTPPPPGRPAAVTPREFYFCNQIIQLMENVHLDLHLDDTWDDPDNAGWKDLFLRCSRSGTFRIVWEKSSSTYGKRFHYFCRRKLNLS
jgi:hypothetical protein